MWYNTFARGGKEMKEYEVAKFDAVEHGFVGTYALKVERAHYMREAERISKLCKELAKKLEERTNKNEDSSTW